MLWMLYVLCLGCILTVPNVSSMPKVPVVGLPNVPGAPNVPDVGLPNTSDVPKVPIVGLPNISGVPKISDAGVPNVSDVPTVSGVPKVPGVGVPNVSDVPTVSGVRTVPSDSMFYIIPQVSGVPNVPNAPKAYGIRTVSGVPNVLNVPKAYGIPTVSGVQHVPNARVSVLNNARIPEQNPAIFEGDIEIRPSQNERGFIKWTSKMYRWPGGVVPYVIDTHHFSFRERMTINRAMSTIASKTGNCIKFKHKTNETAYLRYQGGTGCHTPIGYDHDVSGVTLGSGCGRLGTIMHETMHALGFWHEHSRPDRNNYVNIKWNNILTGHHQNFYKYPSSMIDTLGTQYDYESVMHYGAYEFAKERKKVTIAVKQLGAAIGQRTHLSTTDIRRIKLFYEC